MVPVSRSGERRKGKKREKERERGDFQQGDGPLRRQDLKEDPPTHIHILGVGLVVMSTVMEGTAGLKDALHLKDTDCRTEKQRNEMSLLAAQKARPSNSPLARCLKFLVSEALIPS